MKPLARFMLHIWLPAVLAWCLAWLVIDVARQMWQWALIQLVCLVVNIGLIFFWRDILNILNNGEPT